MPFSTGPCVPGGAYISYGFYSFDDYSALMGPLTIGMTLEADSPLSANSVMFNDFGSSVMILPGDELTVTVKAINNGTEPVKTLS